MFTTKLHQITALGAVLFLSSVAPSYADDFTVTTNTGVTNGGFDVNGGDTLTINSGVTIDHTGLGALAAVNTVGGGNTVTNNGTIIGDGAMDATGVTLNEFASALNNTGLISTKTTTLAGSHGVAGIGGGVSIMNIGRVTTSGDNAHGLYIEQSSNIAENTGTIRVTGVGSNAVHFTGSSNTYRTSGATISSQGQAIFFGGAEVNLEISAPAYIQGGITLPNTNGVTINTGQSHSFQWTFDGVPWGSMTINGSVPTVISGNIVASIDPTQFEDAPSGMQETVGHVFGSIGDRSKLLVPSIGESVSVSTKYGPIPDEPEIIAPAQANRWAAGFGGLASHSATGVKLSYATGQAGMIAGMDWAKGPNRIFGVVAGGALGAFAADAPFMQSQRIQTTSGFAGIYGARRFGNAVLDYGLMGGLQSHNSQRSINSNLVVGGIDTGRASFGSYYLAPQVSLRRTYGLGSGFALTTSGSLGYVAGWVNGYTETATASTATFAARQFGLGSATAKIALSKSIGATTFGGHLGVVAQSGFGSETVSGTLLGQAWTYTTDAGSPVAGLLGVSARHRFSDSIRGNISADANVGSNGLANIKGSARLSIEF